MRTVAVATAILPSLLWSTTTCSAFSPAFLKKTVSSTALSISSWGTKGSPSRWETEAGKNDNPEERIQAYLKAPEAVEARSNIDGTVLVSGLVQSKDRTDQFLFDLLNHEESAFEFKKIIAFTNSNSFAKKRLLSRSARYTGLLDKLDFVEATSEGALPTVEQLDGVKSWVAVLEEPNLDTVQEIASLAQKAASVENLAILVTHANALPVEESKACLDHIKVASQAGNFQYTLVAVGTLENTPEGNVPYRYCDFDSEDAVLSETATFSRDESLRMISELLQLECGVNKALTFMEVYSANSTEAKLVKGLREAGYARPQEIDHMVRVGPAEYQKAIDEWKTKNPDAARGYTTTDAWWEEERFSQGRKYLEIEDEQAIKAKDARTQEIEKIAREWAKREYFRENTEGTLEDPAMTEEDYVKAVWDRALFEGELKYKQLKGEDTGDEEAALAEFKAMQELKKQTMLKRAKAELKEILEEEDLVGDDLKKKWDSDDDDEE